MCQSRWPRQSPRWEEESVKEHTTISVDIPKSVFEIAVSHQLGRVAECYHLPRSRFATFFATRPPATIVMEACGMAHFWGREFQRQGHRVVLLPPHVVRPYVTRNKTDRAEGPFVSSLQSNSILGTQNPERTAKEESVVTGRKSPDKAC